MKALALVLVLLSASTAHADASAPPPPPSVKRTSTGAKTRHAFGFVLITLAGAAGLASTSLFAYSQLGCSHTHGDCDLANLAIGGSVGLPAMMLAIGGGLLVAW